MKVKQHFENIKGLFERCGNSIDILLENKSRLVQYQEINETLSEELESEGCSKLSKDKAILANIQLDIIKRIESLFDISTPLTEDNNHPHDDDHDITNSDNNNNNPPTTSITTSSPLSSSSSTANITTIIKNTPHHHNRDVEISKVDFPKIIKSIFQTSGKNDDDDDGGGGGGGDNDDAMDLDKEHTSSYDMPTMADYHHEVYPSPRSSQSSSSSSASASSSSISCRSEASIPSSQDN